MSMTMKYGNNIYSAKAIKRSKKKRKFGVLEERKTVDPSKVAGKPYRAVSAQSKSKVKRYESDGFYESRARS